MKFRAGALYRYKRQRLRAWVRRKLFETPPEVVRKADPLAEYRRKRERLSRANATGDIETVKRLTAECREMQWEIEQQ